MNARKIIAGAAIALSLAGCAGQPSPSINTGAAKAQISAAAQKAKAALDKVCANYVLADSVFDLLAWTGKIPQNVITAEGTAVAQIQAICDNPPSDAQSALSAATSAWATVQKIRKDWAA